MLDEVILTGRARHFEGKITLPTKNKSILLTMKGGGNCSSKSTAAECKDEIKNTQNPMIKHQTSFEAVEKQLKQTHENLLKLRDERAEAIKDMKEKDEKWRKVGLEYKAKGNPTKAEMAEFKRLHAQWKHAESHVERLNVRANLMFANKKHMEAILHAHKNAGKRKRNRKTIRKAKWGSRTTLRRF